jgi:hypothetical protein
MLKRAKISQALHVVIALAWPERSLERASGAPGTVERRREAVLN